MPKQRQFEGPVLEDILEMVHDTYGHDVEIASADKVRKGGLGGFFAKELYQVTVEVPDGRKAKTTDLLARANGVADAMPVTRRSEAGGIAVFEDPEVVADPVPPHDERSALAPRPAPTPPAHDDPESTTDGEFVDLRQAIAAQRRRDIAAASAPGPATAPPNHRLSTEGSGFAAVLAQISEEARRQEEAPAAPADDDDLVEQGLVRRRFRAGRTSAEPAPVPVRGRARETASPRTHTFDTADLVRLGLPPQYLRRDLTATDQLGALLELASEFPTAPALPRTGDAVIALVGDRRGMLEVATLLHEELELNPDRLMVASRRDTDKLPPHRRIDTIEAAEAQRRAWRRRGEPMLVVVDEPVNRVRTSWSRHVLDALAPEAVVGVVDAHRKPEDIVDWTERLGGVDALALCGTDETSSPAAVLATGIPVSMIDGRSASAARWAAILDERLYAG